ncbi:hypothetical protein PR202_gb16342 [Eleusine coracana subsp. coracana]|uniref:Uncharacterized protein n=1 Tax=Eleusine coracana subsp. coracana TaxID=191504 RepID=A0AAV5F199_ELECO|nr:hypothetical protein QOZ80_9BG0699400 [Eleusine coracana subsp. coracana]GJN28240.1 hypothetical protein PR202_gb16342 [Eleusine coracana subsp. coracana]
MACHQRSASLPSLPYSIESNVEEELQILQACISSPSATIDTACDGLRRLGDVYSCVEEMMCLPSNQVGLSLAQQRRTVEEELDRSLELIDLCNAVQENLAELKMCVQDLRLVLKRGDDAAAQLRIESFVRLAKKAQKPLKKTSSKAGDEGSRLVRIMAGARETTVSLLETTSRLLPKQIGSPSASKWSLVSKRFQRRKVVCEELQLRALERSMRDLEGGVEFLFRRLIQSRVSLLNILSS